jgi:hypothetical protein
MIESNAKYRYLKKSTCGRFLSVRGPSPPMTLYTPPPIRVYSILIHTGKGESGGGGELTEEKVRGAIVHKAGQKYQHD